MKYSSACVMFLLVGCTPTSGSNGLESTATTIRQEPADEPVGETALDREVVVPDVTPPPSAPPTRGPASRTGNGMQVEPMPGEVQSSRTGWSQVAVGGRGDAYAPSGPNTIQMSTATSPGAATYGGGGFVDIRGQAVGQNRFEFTITEADSGWVETFLLQVPSVPSEQPAPLLVLFHKYGGSHLDAENRTDFFSEADARGWYVVSPLSAATKHFGSNAAQFNTQMVIDFVLNFYGDRVDQNRIYGVGFSMGGGSMLTFAARHVDPDRGMFAALLSHTGSGALRHTYGNSPDDDDSDDDIQTGQNLEIPDILDFWFGGPPALVPFEYQRHSIMDIDEFGTVNYATSLITNLVHVPIHTWYATDDPQTASVAQSHMIWDEFLNTYGGTSVLTQVPGTVHKWNTLDEVAALDWLQQYTLTLPSSGTTLADDDGKWFYFDVEQDAPGSFTSLDWSVDTATNTLTLNGTSNLTRVTVDTLTAGLDPSSNLTLIVGAADGLGDQVRFTNVTQSPANVRRDGVSNPNWVYDAQAQTLTILEYDDQPHWWRIVAP